MLEIKTEHILTQRQKHSFISRSRVSKGGAEVLADVGLQNRIEMMELPVCDQSNNEDLSEPENREVC